ncbi:methyl-accepting chemotaxis protein [Litchfieldella xinjiangensis]|uniref:methyl-accepting chemotaxis protein n=1 Tax=Litchfieldella xinjiangensis TaxID=1166948 RepID=UPI0009DFDBD0|nr:methyl-accepting chemotaxis protein [Halomonas xinjiangensis]
MTSLLHRIPVGRKFALALLLPLLAMAYFAIAGIIERQQVVSEMTHLTSLTQVAQEAGKLMHESQRERGMTSGFLGSGGQTFRDELRNQRLVTERQVAALLETYATLKVSQESDIARQLSALKSQWNASADIRRRVDSLSVPTAEAIGYYTQLNQTVLAMIGQIVHATQQAEVTRNLGAYYALLEAKDLAGIERALLANAFAADKIEPALYQRFLTLIGEEAAFLQSFRTLATHDMRAQAETALSGADIERLNDLRERVMARSTRGRFGVDPQQWFAWQTVKIERLKTLEDQFETDLLAMEHALLQEARMALFGYMAVAALAALLAIGLSLLIVRAMVRPLERALQAISQRGGDLTQRLDVPGSDELSRLYQAFNASTEETERLVGNIQQSALSIEVASGEIAQGNQDLAQRTEEQSASLVQTASSMEEITATVRQAADNAHQAQGMSEQVADQAREASQVAIQARDAMTQIQNANQQVTAIVAAIDSIAFQTNLLALNASVEAARAGEHGHGFAVVAAEVRQLASRSAGEAQRIRQLIQNNVTTITDGSQLVSTTSDTLDAIAGRIGQVAKLIADIAAASQEQSAGIEQINQAVAQLEDVTQQNAALVEEVSAASRSLDDQANDMSALVGEFRVSQTQAPGADALRHPSHAPDTTAMPRALPRREADFA